MKLRVLSVFGTLVLVAILGAILVGRTRPNAQKAAEEARQILRQQGFKTDLADFDFSANDETTVRATALTNLSRTRPPVLLEPCGTESAIIAWKAEAKVEETEGYQNLPPIEQVLADDRDELDSACTAILAGPIRFPLVAKHGSSMLLVHLAPLKGLSQTLAARMVIELREQHYNAAWTNLLALTRLTTAWDPEPIDISHLVRFNLARVAWKATWQALQTHSLTHEQLIALQREWEMPDFFKGLPETAAFRRASTVDSCIRYRTAPASGIPFKDTLENAVRSPGSLAADAKFRWERAQYLARGTYEDEHDLLLFYRDRELEFRKAITTPNWLQMRALPGVTNGMAFRSRYSSPWQALLNSRQLTLSFQLEGKSLLGRAAETEARRRMVIAAIALERYRVGHGSYPKELQSVAPEVLSNVPVDFMDGKPLHYRLREPDAFVLYSVGLDCIDNGGKISVAKNIPRATYPELDSLDSPDMVWPRAASDEEVKKLRGEQTLAKAEQKRNQEQEADQREKEQEAQRREIISQLAEIYAKGESPKIADTKIEGGALSQVLRNNTIGGPPLRLEQMLILRQITTGNEPDIATFELPISYDALTNVGTLRLLSDADPAEKYSDEASELEEGGRATNGNCRLFWNTTYSAPGKHFLQAELIIDKWRPSRRHNDDTEEIALKGPLFSFVSTNVIQFFPMGNVYSEKGAFFHVKLAQPIGSYSLQIMTPSGEHIHTITGSTTNGIVEVHWDLLYAGGKRYTNESFNSTWTVTFPDPSEPTNANPVRPIPSRSDDQR